MRARIRYWLAPGFRQVELTCADYMAQRFSQHWHTGFAVGVVTRHAQGFRTNGRDWSIGEGDLITLNPGQIHNGYPLDARGWSSRMAYIPADIFRSLAGGIPSSGACHFEQAVIHAPALAHAFLSWHERSEVLSDLRECRETAVLFAKLLSLTQSGRPRSPALCYAELSGPLGQHMVSLAQHGDTRVASLNLELDLTRFGSWRRVKTELGLAPKPLMSHIRLMSAKQMLAQGAPVIDAALDCGFHDQSHFSRQFAAAYGFTPAQFRSAQLLQP